MLQAMYNLMSLFKEFSILNKQHLLTKYFYKINYYNIKLFIIYLYCNLVAMQNFYVLQT